MEKRASRKSTRLQKLSDSDRDHSKDVNNTTPNKNSPTNPVSNLADSSYSPKILDNSTELENHLNDSDLFKNDSNSATSECVEECYKNNVKCYASKKNICINHSESFGLPDTSIFPETHCGIKNSECSITKLSDLDMKFEKLSAFTLLDLKYINEPWLVGCLISEYINNSTDIRFKAKEIPYIRKQKRLRKDFSFSDLDLSIVSGQETPQKDIKERVSVISTIQIAKSSDQKNEIISVLTENIKEVIEHTIMSQNVVNGAIGDINMQIEIINSSNIPQTETNFEDFEDDDEMFELQSNSPGKKDIKKIPSSTNNDIMAVVESKHKIQESSSPILHSSAIFKEGKFICCDVKNKPVGKIEAEENIKNLKYNSKLAEAEFAQLKSNKVQQNIPSNKIIKLSGRRCADTADETAFTLPEKILTVNLERYNFSPEKMSNSSFISPRKSPRRKVKDKFLHKEPNIQRRLRSNSQSESISTEASRVLAEEKDRRKTRARSQEFNSKEDSIVTELHLISKRPKSCVPESPKKYVRTKSVEDKMSDLVRKGRSKSCLKESMKNSDKEDCKTRSSQEKRRSKSCVREIVKNTGQDDDKSRNSKEEITNLVNKRRSKSIVQRSRKNTEEGLKTRNSEGQLSGLVGKRRSRETTKKGIKERGHDENCVEEVPNKVDKLRSKSCVREIMRKTEEDDICEVNNVLETFNTSVHQKRRSKSCAPESMSKIVKNARARMSNIQTKDKTRSKSCVQDINKIIKEDMKIRSSKEDQESSDFHIVSNKRSKSLTKDIQKYHIGKTKYHEDNKMLDAKTRSQSGVPEHLESHREERKKTPVSIKDINSRITLSAERKVRSRSLKKDILTETSNPGLNDNDASKEMTLVSPKTRSKKENDQKNIITPTITEITKADITLNHRSLRSSNIEVEIKATPKINKESKLPQRKSLNPKDSSTSNQTVNNGAFKSPIMQGIKSSDNSSSIDMEINATPKVNKQIKPSPNINQKDSITPDQDTETLKSLLLTDTKSYSDIDMEIKVTPKVNKERVPSQRRSLNHKYSTTPLQTIKTDLIKSERLQDTNIGMEIKVTPKILAKARTVDSPNQRRNSPRLNTKQIKTPVLSDQENYMNMVNKEDSVEKNINTTQTSIIHTGITTVESDTNLDIHASTPSHKAGRSLKVVDTPEPMTTSHKGIGRKSLTHNLDSEKSTKINEEVSDTRFSCETVMDTSIVARQFVETEDTNRSKYHKSMKVLTDSNKGSRTSTPTRRSIRLHINNSESMTDNKIVTEKLEATSQEKYTIVSEDLQNRILEAAHDGSASIESYSEDKSNEIAPKDDYSHCEIVKALLNEIIKSIEANDMSRALSHSDVKVTLKPIIETSNGTKTESLYSNSNTVHLVTSAKDDLVDNTSDVSKNQGRRSLRHKSKIVDIPKTDKQEYQANSNVSKDVGTNFDAEKIHIIVNKTTLSQPNRRSLKLHDKTAEKCITDKSEDLVVVSTTSNDILTNDIESDQEKSSVLSEGISKDDSASNDASNCLSKKNQSDPSDSKHVEENISYRQNELSKISKLTPASRRSLRLHRNTPEKCIASETEGTVLKSKTTNEILIQLSKNGQEIASDFTSNSNDADKNVNELNQTDSSVSNDASNNVEIENCTELIELNNIAKISTPIRRSERLHVNTLENSVNNDPIIESKTSDSGSSKDASINLEGENCPQIIELNKKAKILTPSRRSIRLHANTPEKCITNETEDETSNKALTEPPENNQEKSSVLSEEAPFKSLLTVESTSNSDKRVSEDNQTNSGISKDVNFEGENGPQLIELNKMTKITAPSRRSMRLHVSTPEICITNETEDTILKSETSNKVVTEAAECDQEKSSEEAPVTATTLNCDLTVNTALNSDKHMSEETDSVASTKESSNNVEGENCPQLIELNKKTKIPTPSRRSIRLHINTSEIMNERGDTILKNETSNEVLTESIENNQEKSSVLSEQASFKSGLTVETTSNSEDNQTDSGISKDANNISFVRENCPQSIGLNKVTKITAPSRRSIRLHVNTNETVDTILKSKTFNELVTEAKECDQEKSSEEASVTITRFKSDLNVDATSNSEENQTDSNASSKEASNNVEGENCLQKIELNKNTKIPIPSRRSIRLHVNTQEEGTMNETEDTTLNSKISNKVITEELSEEAPFKSVLAVETTSNSDKHVSAENQTNSDIFKDLSINFEGENCPQTIELNKMTKITAPSRRSIRLHVNTPEICITKETEDTIVKTISSNKEITEATECDQEKSSEEAPVSSTRSKSDLTVDTTSNSDKHISEENQTDSLVSTKEASSKVDVENYPQLIEVNKMKEKTASSRRKSLIISEDLSITSKKTGDDIPMVPISDALNIEVTESEIGNNKVTSEFSDSDTSEIVKAIINKIINTIEGNEINILNKELRMSNNSKSEIKTSKKRSKRPKKRLRSNQSNQSALKLVNASDENIKSEDSKTILDNKTSLENVPTSNLDTSEIKTDKIDDLEVQSCLFNIPLISKDSLRKRKLKPNTKNTTDEEIPVSFETEVEVSKNIITTEETKLSENSSNKRNFNEEKSTIFFHDTDNMNTDNMITCCINNSEAHIKESKNNKTSPNKEKPKKLTLKKHNKRKQKLNGLISFTDIQSTIIKRKLRSPQNEDSCGSSNEDVINPKGKNDQEITKQEFKKIQYVKIGSNWYSRQYDKNNVCVGIKFLGAKNPTKKTKKNRHVVKIGSNWYIRQYNQKNVCVGVKFYGPKPPKMVNGQFIFTQSNTQNPDDPRVPQKKVLRNKKVRNALTSEKTSSNNKNLLDLESSVNNTAIQNVVVDVTEGTSANDQNRVHLQPANIKNVSKEQEQILMRDDAFIENGITSEVRVMISPIDKSLIKEEIVLDCEDNVPLSQLVPLVKEEKEGVQEEEQNDKQTSYAGLEENASTNKTDVFDGNVQENIKTEMPVPLMHAKHFKEESTITQTHFNVGSFVWAQLSKYPFWPAYVCKEPQSKLFKKQIGAYHKLIYHVKFFGDKGRRAWVYHKNMMLYCSKSDLELIANRLKFEKSSLIKQYIVQPSLMKIWQAAVEELESVKTKSYKEIMNILNQQSKEANKRKSISLKDIESDSKEKHEGVQEKPGVIKDVEETAQKTVEVPVTSEDTVQLENGPQNIVESVDKIKEHKELPNATKHIRSSRRSKEHTTVISEAEKIEESSPNPIFKKPLAESSIDILQGRPKRRKQIDEISEAGSKTSSSDMTLSSSISNPYSLEAQIDLFKRNNLFKGLSKEKVCQHCMHFGDIFRCKGCNNTYHYECSMLVTEIKPVKKKKESRMSLESEWGDISQPKKRRRLRSSSVSTSREENSVDLKLEVNSEEMVVPVEQEAKVEEQESIKPVEDESLSPGAPSPKNIHIEELCLEEQIDLKMQEVMNSLDAKNIYYVDSSSNESQAEEDIVKSSQPVVNDKPIGVKRKKRSSLKPTQVEFDNYDETPSTSTSSSPSVTGKLKEIRHVTADGIIFSNLEFCEKRPTGFKCGFCSVNMDPYCFVCHLPVSKSGSDIRIKCSLYHCGKYYHKQCLKLWPQTQWSLIKSTKHRDSVEEIDSFVCPSHVCHTCASDDPRAAISRCPSDKTVKCLRCPASYHSTNYCVPAGTEILSSTQILCPRHRTRNVQPLNTTWCFICSEGGNLICCETCPTSIHPECQTVNLTEDDKFICDDCESGRFPLYNEVVWVKLGSYRWWPAIVLFPNEVPENVKATKHQRGDFAVKFFGTNDYYWVNKTRSFLFQEGDRGHPCDKSKKKIYEIFGAAIEEATLAHKLKKEFKNLTEAETLSSLKPPPYIKIKVNKPVGNVRTMDLDLSNSTACSCDPSQPHPCGPDSDCINRLLLTECDIEVCPAGSRCRNQSFDKREYAPMTAFKTQGRGWGLRTLAPVKKGQFVIEYVGEVIDSEEYQRRIVKMHEQKEENYYFLTIDKDRMIDAGPKGNLSRFMNHSCNPNCETQKWTVHGDTRVGLFAMKDIPVDSELTFNYNLECVGKEKKPCRCDAPNCSGFIGVKAKQDNTVVKKTKKICKVKEPVKPTVVPCFICKRKSAPLICNNKSCNKGYHAKCLKLTHIPEASKFVCPRHNCNICSNRTIRCCVKCTNSYCPTHAEGNVRHENLVGFLCRVHDSIKIQKLPSQKRRISHVTANDTDVISTTSVDNYMSKTNREKRRKISKKSKRESGNVSDSTRSSPDVRITSSDLTETDV